MKPENVDRKISADTRRRVAESSRPKGIEIHDDQAHVLSRAERGELRHHLREVQIRGSSAEQVRAVRLLQLVDLAEQVDARELELAGAADAAADLVSEIDEARDRVGSALALDLTETVGDLLQDNPGIDPEALAAKILELAHARIGAARDESTKALEGLEAKITAHSERMEALTA